MLVSSFLTCGYCLSLSFHSLPSPLPRSWLPATPPQKWHMCLADIVQDRIPPFDHRSFQPGLYAHRLLCDALDHYLIVANEDWLAPRHSSLRSHKSASASLKPSAPVPCTVCSEGRLTFACPSPVCR